MSVGFDHIDVEECRKRNIKVGYTPDVSTESVAELGVALLLTTSRRVPETMNAAKNGEWPVWSPFWMCGREIYGSTIGFYGCGRIGESMVEKLLPFKPKRIIYHNKNKKSNSSLEYVSFGELLSESDFLIIGVNCTPETKGKFDRHTLNKMKKGAILINISRGTIVKSMDLYEALINGHPSLADLFLTTAYVQRGPCSGLPSILGP